MKQMNKITKEQALEKLRLLVEFLNDIFPQGEGYDWKDYESIVDLEQYITQPNNAQVEEVCKALSEYYKTQYVRYKSVEVVYNEEEFASNVFSLKLNGRIRNPLAFIDSLGVVNINAFLPPKEFALLGQFYESVVSK